MRVLAAARRHRRRRPAPGPPPTGWPTPPATTSAPSAASSALAEALDETVDRGRRGARRRCGQRRRRPRVIVEALDALPASLDPELRDKAEAHLVSEAGHFGPQQLQRIGRGLLEVVAPEIADEAEYQRLVAEEKRSRAADPAHHPRPRRRHQRHHRPDPHPGRAPAQDLPRRPHHPRAGTRSGDVDQLPLPRRRGEAFCALLENLPAKGLPKHGGTATSVMVIIDLDTLRAETGHSAWAETSTGDRITAEQARRLACQARHHPRRPRRQGRDPRPRPHPHASSPRPNARPWPLRDRDCTADGCDIPAAWCEAHHFKKTLVQRRQDQPRRRQAPLLLPPPPSPRPRLDHHTTTPTAPPPSTGGRDILGISRRDTRAMTFTARVQTAPSASASSGGVAPASCRETSAPAPSCTGTSSNPAPRLPPHGNAWRFAAGALLLGGPHGARRPAPVSSAFVTGALSPAPTPRGCPC